MLEEDMILLNKIKALVETYQGFYLFSFRELNFSYNERSDEHIMVFIKVFAKDENGKMEILKWMTRQIMINGHISLMDLLDQHTNELTLDDNDWFGYYEVGWNLVDLDVLFEALNEKNLRIPNPKLRFEPHYT